MAGMNMPSETIMVMYNPDGSVSKRQKISFKEAQELLSSGEAFEVEPTALDDLTAKKVTLPELFKAATSVPAPVEGSPEAVEAEEQGWLQRARSKLPFGGDRRAKMIDEQVEGNM
jgi:hypothetical protein